MLTLSICIPTYNRAALLAQALEAIAGQLTEAMACQVEVIVSDNASPDNTREAMANFAAAHPAMRLTYIRQPQNLGADGNILYVVNRASGEFVFILSDDDVLLPGALDKILEVLAAEPAIDAIGLNARIFQSCPEEPTGPVRIIQQDRLVCDRDEMLTTLGTWITFISALVFRKSLIDGQDYACRIGTLCLQSYIFLDVLARAGSCWLTRQPYLAIRGNNTGGYSFFTTFVSDFGALLDHAVQLGFSRRATRRVLIDHEAFILGFVITFKVRGSIGTLRLDFGDGLRRIWRVYRSEPIFLLKVTPLLLMPRAAVLLVRRLRRLLKRGS